MMQFFRQLTEAVYPETKAPLAAFFGDSVTHGAFESVEGEEAGCRFDFEAVYHHILQKKLRMVNPWLPVSILNAGVAGDTANHARARLEQDVLSHRPDLCVVNFALNDINDPLEIYISSLTEILQRLSENVPQVILLTPNMLNTYVHENTAQKNRDYAAQTAEYQKSGKMDRYVQSAREIAASLHIPVADAYADWKAMNAAGSDTTAMLANYINHPKREWHTIFADAIFKTLAQD